MKQDYRTKHKWTIDDPDQTRSHAASRRTYRKIRWVFLIILLILLIIGAYVGKSWHQNMPKPTAKKTPQTTEIPLTLPASNK